MNNKIQLPLEKLPRKWLNIAPFMKSKPYPLLLPNGKPADFDTMCQIFPTECVKQAVSQEEFIDIPKEILEAYVLCSRPTPIQRAYRLEKAIGVEGDDIKIFFKREDVSPMGSHKGNTAIAQAYFAREQGLKGLTTETGAGQWGSALSLGGALMDLQIKVWMVRISYQQKPGRKTLMNSLGATVLPSPSDQTQAGKKFYEKDSNHPGSLGIAISEAVEASMSSDEFRYSLGSVVDFVCLHQTIVGQEAKMQMEMINEYPDVIIGCIGGGSNFAGLAFPFMKDKLTGKKPNLDIIGVEPMACPSLTKGEFTWDFGDTAHVAPIVKMYTLGNSFIPAPVHAGGLRYHGAAPLVSLATHDGVMRSIALHQLETLNAGIIMSKSEALIPAPETTHALAAAINVAKEAKQNGEKKTILYNHSGHGFLDLQAYEKLIAGDLVDYEYPDEEVKKSLSELPDVDESTFMG
ncbi:MAG: TrpB-like pyridoxal phosphate-dependent enzyme [Candidatus Lokiarchaeota archaeon]|nr:TrpB-like pyridoxal phosphate-dependent enzyme [Candidatus Lokiarchaeota archaeon]